MEKKIQHEMRTVLSSMPAYVGLSELLSKVVLPRGHEG